MDKLIEKIDKCNSMEELDLLRMECVSKMQKSQEAFVKIQNAFRKKKNKLRYGKH